MTLADLWYGGHRLSWLAWLLVPLAGLYRLVVMARRRAHAQGWLASERLTVPVIVVGNLSVGGTGKTPLVLWLVDWLRGQGWRPGIILRGYGGQARDWPHLRRAAAAGAWAVEDLDPEGAAWMDDGMFARWVTADFPLLDDYLAELDALLTDHVMAGVRGVLAQWELLEE